MKNTKWDESRLKNWVSLAYRVGIAVSLTLIGIGFIMLIYISGINNIQLQIRLEQLPAAIVISFGILFLLLIPMVQVILSIIFFSINRNRLFITISVAVLCFAAISLALLLT
jgi:uncharacterized membrane protein